MKKLYILTALTLLLLGCNDAAVRSHFADIVVGQATWTNRMCFLPVDMPTKIIHSAQWIYKVDSKVEGTNIFLTAHITKPPHQVKQAYPGKINLGSIRPGTYTLAYRDPQGTIHSIGTTKIDLPNK